MQSLTKLIEWTVILISATMTFIVIIQAILRYVFGTTLFWGMELSRYLTVWTVLLAAGLVLKERGHISVGVVINRFKGRLRLWIDLLAQVLLLIFLTFLLILSSMKLPAQLKQGTMSLPVSMFWFYLSIPIGAFLMILYLSTYIYRTANCIKKNLTDPDCRYHCEYPKCSVWMEEKGRELPSTKNQ